MRARIKYYNNNILYCHCLFNPLAKHVRSWMGRYMNRAYTVHIWSPSIFLIRSKIIGHVFFKDFPGGLLKKKSLHPI